MDRQAIFPPAGSAGVALRIPADDVDGMSLRQCNAQLANIVQQVALNNKGDDFQRLVPLAERMIELLQRCSSLIQDEDIHQTQHDLYEQMDLIQKLRDYQIQHFPSAVSTAFHNLDVILQELASEIRVIQEGLPRTEYKRKCMVVRSLGFN